MVWQSKNTKKLFLVFMSLIFGSAIVFGAIKISGVFSTNVSFESPELANDGSWMNALSIIPGANTATRVERGSIQAEKAFMATTTTDLIARRLVVEYSLSQRATATSTMSDADAKNIASILAQEVKLPPKKDYSLSDLNISDDNSHEASILYANTVNTLMSNYLKEEQKENELTMLITAMNTKDATLLSRIDTKVLLYQSLIKKLLALKTPSSVAHIHLHLVQSFETLRSATDGFQGMLTDPAMGVVALTEYRDGHDALTLTRREYYDFFSK